MRELAEHIGPYAVMQIVDRYGGLDLYVPMSADGWYIGDLIGKDKAEILSKTCGREQLPLPVARYALDQARRAGIIAAVRSGGMTLTEAAWILRAKRRTVWHLANKTDEGKATAPAAPLTPLRPRAKQLTFLDE